MRSLQEMRLLARDPANFYFHIIFLVYSLTFVLFIAYQNKSIEEYLTEKYGINELFVNRMMVGMLAVSLINMLKIIIVDQNTMKIVFVVISVVALIIMTLFGVIEDKKY